MTRSAIANLLILLSIVLGIVGDQRKAPIESSIVLSSKDGSLTLVYDLRKFEPQAKTLEDIAVLSRYVTEVSKDLKSQGDMVGFLSLGAAIRSRDFQTIERIIYENQRSKLRASKQQAGNGR